MRADLCNQTGWRRLTGWCAAYLLVLHLGLAGASTGHFFAQAGDFSAGAVFCLSGNDGPISPLDQPVHPAHGKIHCALCAGGGSLALPPSTALAAPLAAPVSVLVPAGEIVGGPGRHYSPNQSRAPPLPA